MIYWIILGIALACFAVELVFMAWREDRDTAAVADRLIAAQDRIDLAYHGVSADLAGLGWEWPR